MLRRIGATLLIVGGLAALTGVLWSMLPHPDANIGAGLLAVLGFPVAGIGLVLLVIAVILARRARRDRS